MSYVYCSLRQLHLQHKKTPLRFMQDPSLHHHWDPSSNSIWWWSETSWLIMRFLFNAFVSYSRQVQMFDLQHSEKTLFCCQSNCVYVCLDAIFLIICSHSILGSSKSISLLGWSNGEVLVIFHTVQNEYILKAPTVNSAMRAIFENFPILSAVWLPPNTCVKTFSSFKNHDKPPITGIHNEAKTKV